ncbi:chromobox protein homolog 1-like isoform X2 [Rhopilema esculentum]|uniref:chromobox protein homolog 1-like isoform X2 n=1 Tax=Rhopilema esculentum TaxID=499914 RepID=UPI0031D02564
MRLRTNENFTAIFRPICEPVKSTLTVRSCQEQNQRLRYHNLIEGNLLSMMGKSNRKRTKKIVAEEEEDEYQVEKIIDKRVSNGVVEYFLKWRGFSELENTWEPEANLNCTELLHEFNANLAKADGPSSSSITEEKEPVPDSKGTEEQQEEKSVKESTDKPDTKLESSQSEKKDKKEKKPVDKEQKSVKRKAEKAESSGRKEKRNKLVLNGFDKGYKAQSILGATDSAGGELHFLISWANSSDAELIPSKIANVKIPQMVIKFYEDRLIWTNANSENAAGSSKSPTAALERPDESEPPQSTSNGDANMEGQGKQGGADATIETA